jgi:hypothetical protein
VWEGGRWARGLWKDDEEEEEEEEEEVQGWNLEAGGLGAAAVQGARLGNHVEVGAAVGRVPRKAHNEVLERVDVVVHFHLWATQKKARRGA